MIFDDFIKMLAEINDLSDLNENSIIERIKTKLEENDLRRWKSRRFDVNHIFTIDYNLKATLLHFAAGCGCKNIVVALIESGANVNARDKNGCTPLHYAAVNSFKDVVEILVVNGAYVNAHDNHGFAPSFYAAKWGYRDIATFLLRSEANFEPRTEMEVESAEQVAPAERLKLF
ncbi:MAG: ankyrin repeat domain-containing protein [Wolbachia sp.]